MSDEERRHVIHEDDGCVTPSRLVLYSTYTYLLLLVVAMAREDGDGDAGVHHGK
jgi:hypothetical protein